ncbi:hypothetical protein ACO0SA_004106 [Hanseniaspora valbyensis]
MNDDNIIDKLKELDEELNIKFDSSDKENFDKYTHLFQLCNYITDYKKSNRRNTDDLKLDEYDISDDDEFININGNSDREEGVEEEKNNLNKRKLEYLSENDDVHSSSEDEENDGEILTLPSTVDLINSNNVSEFIIHLFGLKKTDSLFNNILSTVLEIEDFDECSKNLHKIINVTKLRLIPKLLKYKDLISYGLQYNLSESIEDKDMVLQELKEKKLFHLLPNTNNKRKLDQNIINNNNKKAKKLLNINKYKLPLDDEEFMTKQAVKLPEKSYKINKENYTELHIPPPDKPESNFTLLSIKTLPTWAQAAFPIKETSTLNRIQSEVYPTVFHSEKNVLVCAPTGAGKTNIAILSILQTISKYINEKGKLKQDSHFKCVYIAPLRALVQEQVTEFQRRLAPFDIRVVELTGDSDTSKKELISGHVIVSTPEKWDIISRKFNNKSLIKQCKLMILDEVHLLHEERGPVIETISIRMMDNNCRIVALSATLPNYQDVADFLKVGPKGLFFFSPDFRPCPLKQEFIAVKGGQNNPVKELININKACYDKVSEHLQQNFQIIVFVHSRKDTVKTARYILEAFKKDTKMQEWLNSQDSVLKNILTKESENCENSELSYLIKNGIAIHHAGLSRTDRSQSEDLFADGVIKLLISTKTISWGVNLPAHTVIIKGTDIYSPPLSKWVKLSIQDMLQMLGRAGRPRYDTHGEGIIITNQLGVNHYLLLLMDQMKIESRFLDRVVDFANAEICSGAIKTKEDMKLWFKKTYWFIRMNKDRKIYKTEGLNLDVFLDMLADSVLDKLKISKMCTISYDDNENDSIQHSVLASIASDFYITYESIFDYYNNLNKEMTILELFQLFSKSKEFESMLVRAEEKYEMKVILSKLPIPVKDSLEDIGCKPNALIQSYISRLSMDGFALNSDMIFIKQNSSRLFQALLQIAKFKKMSKIVKLLLNIVHYVGKRVWLTDSPLRQFGLEPNVIKKIEMCYLDWELLINKSEEENYDDLLDQMAPSLVNEKKLIVPCLLKFPKLGDISVTLQPLTRTFYRLTLMMTPNFKWDFKIHNNFLPFLVILEDCNGETILFEKSLSLKSYNIGVEVSFQFEIEILDSNLPPNLFLSIISENWLHCGYKKPVFILNEIKQIDALLPAPTQFSDNKLKNIKQEIGKLDIPEFNNLIGKKSNDPFPSDFFNKYQNDVSQIILNTNENVLLCSPPNTGKNLIAKLAILKAYQLGHSRIVYINNDDKKLENLKKWLLNYYPHGDGELLISKFEDDINNKSLFNKSHILLSSFENFEFFSREWKDSKNFQNMNLVILDDLEVISDSNNSAKGYIYETLVARLTLMETQLENGLRFIGLSQSISNYIEFGEWLGIERDNCFNYNNELFTKNFISNAEIIEYENDKKNFNFEANQVYDIILKKLENLNSSSKKAQTVIYVTDRTSALETAEILISKTKNDSSKLFSKLVGVSDELLSMFTDSDIASFFVQGIFIFYWNMDNDDKMILQKFIKSATVLISDSAFIISSEIVFIQNTECLKDTNNSLGLSKIEPFKFMNMVTSCKNDGILRILTCNKKYFNKILNESQFSFESSMLFHFTELLINEINSGIIEKKTDILEWFSYTLFNTRLHKNPSYYGVKNNDSLTLSKFVTSLIDQSIEELKVLELIEDTPIINDEGEEDLKLTLNPSTFAVSKLNLTFEDFEILFVNLEQANNIYQFLEIISSLPSLEHLNINSQGSINQINKIFNNKEMNSYKNKLSPQVFKIFYLLYIFLKEGSVETLPVSLQMDLKSIVKTLISLLQKVFKMYVIEKDTSKKISNKRIQLLIQVIKSLSLEIPLFNEVLEKQISLLQIPYITEEQIDTLMNEKEVFSVEKIISEKLNDFVNEDEDEDVEEFLQRFPLAKMTHKFEDDLEIIVENVAKSNEDGINYGGEYYCILTLEGTDDIMKIVKIDESGKKIIKKEELPTGAIIIELVNDSFITEKQIIKIFNQ